MTPDWAMVGAPNSDGTVSLWASTSLTRAELEYRTETDAIGYGFESRSFITSREYVITAVMDDFVLIVAPDYQTAFSALFKQWSPPVRTPRGIAEGRRELAARPD